MQPYYLLSLDATVDQRNLPLGYSCKDKEPNPSVICDRENCLFRPGIHNQQASILNCGHSFHQCCLEEKHECGICAEFLIGKISKLVKTFNEGLLFEEDPEVNDEDDDDPDDDNDRDDDPEQRNADEDQEQGRKLDAAGLTQLRRQLLGKLNQN